jgi:hypothetical protein
MATSSSRVGSGGGGGRNNDGRSGVSGVSGDKQQAALLARTREMAALDAVRSSVTITSSLSTIHSSALQADLAKKYNLPGAARVTHSVVRSNKARPAERKPAGAMASAYSTHTTPVAGSRSAPSSSSAVSNDRRYNEPVLCLSCEFENEADSTTCACCGYFLTSARQQNFTLAQKLGISEGPKAVNIITLTEWEAIDEKAGIRNEAFCPICMVGFNQGSEVLLSCSHVFHKACIFSFERFSQSKERTCPICRCIDYQKRMTHKGSKAFQVVCAVNLQAHFRGFLCRKVYRSKLRAYYRNNSVQNSQRRKFYEQELTSYSAEIQKEVDRRSTEVSSFMRYFVEFACRFDTDLKSTFQLHG